MAPSTTMITWPELFTNISSSLVSWWAVCIIDLNMMWWWNWSESPWLSYTMFDHAWGGGPYHGVVDHIMGWWTIPWAQDTAPGCPGLVGLGNEIMLQWEWPSTCGDESDRYNWWGALRPNRWSIFFKNQNLFFASFSFSQLDLKLEHHILN